MTTDSTPRRRRRRHRAPADAPDGISVLGSLALVALVLILPLMMGQRTPATLSASLAVLVWFAVLGFAALSLAGRMALPERSWLAWAGVLTALVAVQVLPLPGLNLLGPYPAAILDHPEVQPSTWSPNPGASLRGWSAFLALFLIAWMASQLPSKLRGLIWLAVVLAALFQALYGLLSHAAGSETVLGIWTRNNPDFVHGSFSNRNLYAAYLALTWPLAVGIWYLRHVPLIHRLPLELRITASVICAAILGAAMLASASRLGAAAGLVSMLMALGLWARHRWRGGQTGSVWPIAAAGLAALVFATWYGLTPLAERLVATTGEEARLEVFALMLTEFPRAWWVHGVGLGGFEAAFRQFQPAHVSGWFDYAHNDLLQWWIETGLIGMALLTVVLIALLKRFRASIESIALLSGLMAIAIVGLGDFSWHIPATQAVIALYIGTLLSRPNDGKR